MTLIDYNDIFYQSQTLSMEVEGMSDDTLIEECNHVLTSNLRTIYILIKRDFRKDKDVEHFIIKIDLRSKKYCSTAR